MTELEQKMRVPHVCTLGCQLPPIDHFPSEPPIQNNGDAIWDEIMTFNMTRGTWADLLDHLGVGQVTIGDGGIILVGRKGKNNATSNSRTT